MLHAFITFAAETLEETQDGSHALFYISGGLLAAWAVVVSFIGIRGHENWPASDGAARGVMGISGVLVFLAMATAVITA